VNGGPSSRHWKESGVEARRRHPLEAHATALRCADRCSPSGEERKVNAPGSSGHELWAQRRQKYSERVIELAVLGVPIYLLNYLVKQVSDQALGQPWHAVVFLAPLAAVLLLLTRRPARRNSLLRLDLRFLAFIGVYVLFFSIAALTEVLTWKREPVDPGSAGLESANGAPESRRSGALALLWSGDWRYGLVPRVAGDDIVVVLREPAAGRRLDAVRSELVQLVGFAGAHGALGLVLDLYFEDVSNQDQLLCAVIQAWDRPVISGYLVEYRDQRPNPVPDPPSLAPCFPSERRGHLIGLMDGDDTIRVVPTTLKHRDRFPSLGMLAARSFAAEGRKISPPDGGLLRYVEPESRVPRIHFVELLSDASARNHLHGRIVVLGDDSPADTFATPFGLRAGAEIHADVLHSLLRDAHVRPMPWWLVFVLILASCYALAAWCADGASAVRLTLLCLVLSLLFVAAAAAAVQLGPYWFEIAYPLAALWLLLPLLLVFRRILSFRSLSSPAPVRIASETVNIKPEGNTP
jgi:CHASE2 domain-containing sensor protein